MTIIIVESSDAPRALLLTDPSLGTGQQARDVGAVHVEQQQGQRGKQ